MPTVQGGVLDPESKFLLGVYTVRMMGNGCVMMSVSGLQGRSWDEGQEARDSAGGRCPKTPNLDPLQLQPVSSQTGILKRHMTLNLVTLCCGTTTVW